VLTIVLFSFIKISGRAIRHFELGSTALGAGMFFYSPNTKDKEVKKSERFLSNRSKNCAHLYILGSSGWDTFGSQESPLHQALLTCNHVEIILINPMSEELAHRVRDLSDVNLDEYRNQIYRTIDFLKDKRNEGNNPDRILLRMYSSYPMWKYIILGRYVWLQQYPANKHVKDSPCYAFHRIENNKHGHTAGMYDHVFAQFKRRWDSPHIGRYNFNENCLEYYTRDGNRTHTVPIVR
jgi:hypothetical protein